MKQLRLNAYLARTGVCARRKAVRLIQEGKVLLNGQKAHPASIVSPRDVVRVQDVIVRIPSVVVFLLYKPPGYICSERAQDAKPLARSLIDCQKRLFSVGRLDYLSAGLLLFTNDGELAHAIAHPSMQIEKEYLLVSKNNISQQMLQAYKKGVTIRRITYRMHRYKREGLHRVRIILTEGKNREIRKVCAHFSIAIHSIVRTRIAMLSLKHMREGHYRKISPYELDLLKQHLYLKEIKK